MGKTRQIFDEVFKNPYARYLTGFIVLVILPIFFWWSTINSQVKSLKVGIVSNFEPINIAGGLKKEDIRIYYRNREIRKLTYLKIRIQNDGNVPIIPQDFIEPLAISFSGDNQFLDFGISPATVMSGAIANDSRTLSLSASLLN